MKDSPARREDYIIVTGSNKFPQQFCSTGCPLLIFLHFFFFFSFFSWHLIFFIFGWNFHIFFFHFFTIMWQFYILPIGIPGPFSSAHTALVCVLGNEVYMQHYWLLVALLTVDSFTCLKMLVMLRYSGLLIRLC